jgi:hypothetical protein
MALISISGVDLPTPTEFSVSVYDISKAERNANGNMIIERVTTKKKLSFSYTYLSAGDLSRLLKAIAPTTYDVTYIDPVDNVTRTSRFYCGDRAVGMIDYQNNVPRYKDLSFDLIEI